jgi:hypothetical protein
MLKGLSGCLQDFTLLPQCPVVAVHVSISFLDDCLDEFLHVGLSEHVLKTHDVTHHFCIEGIGFLIHS